MDGLTRLLDGDEPSLTAAYVRVAAPDEGARRRLSDLGWHATTPPSKVANLGQIGSVPFLLAIVLAALGFAGILHSLLLAVSRRDDDIAIARALGFTPRQARTAVTWHGVATSVAGIIVGVPLGIFVGRVIWKRISTGVGAVDLVSLPWLQFLVVPIATITAVASIASIVGGRASRLRPAQVLRSE